MTDLAAVPQPGDHHARPGLDPDALYVALDRQRRSRRMQWREAAREAGVSPSTFTRIGQGRRPDADGLVRLLAWLGTTDLAPYITTRPPEVGIDRLADRSVVAGRCGIAAPVTTWMSHAPRPVCALPHGHAGWHRADDGCEWGQIRTEESA